MTYEPIVSLRGARRRYGPFEAVRGVDLDVRRGELLALLGTNGAGKTSLVELVEGLAPADAGQVRVLGHDPYRERSQIVGGLGVMLQEAGFSSDLTTVETMRRPPLSMSCSVSPVESSSSLTAAVMKPLGPAENLLPL